MITRRILVTTIVNAMGQEKEIYGRFDAVKLLSDGWKVSDSEFRHYRMSEETFVNNSVRVNTMED